MKTPQQFAAGDDAVYWERCVSVALGADAVGLATKAAAGQAGVGRFSEKGDPVSYIGDEQGACAYGHFPLLVLVYMSFSHMAEAILKGIEDITSIANPQDLSRGKIGLINQAYFAPFRFV